MAISNDEWEQRVLCSDGNCIGIIGADGRCKACGKPYEGVLPDVDTPADRVDEDDPVAGQKTDQTDESTDWEAANDDEPSDDEWENRTLCVDESCIGVIGPDGRCKACGKPYPK